MVIGGDYMEISMNTSEKIKFILIKTGKTQQDIADFLGVKKQSINRNMREFGFRLSDLNKIAVFLNSSLDVYITVNGERYDGNGLPIGMQIHKVAIANNLSQEVLGKRLNLKQTSVSRAMLINDWKENRERQLAEAVGAELHVDFITEYGRI